jgi:hypothetical protein
VRVVDHQLGIDDRLVEYRMQDPPSVRFVAVRTPHLGHATSLDMIDPWLGHHDRFALAQTKNRKGQVGSAQVEPPKRGWKPEAVAAHPDPLAVRPEIDYVFCGVTNESGHPAGERPSVDLLCNMRQRDVVEEPIAKGERATGVDVIDDLFPARGDRECVRARITRR